jgi:t-SNARE complex subunit (syntaxin)
MKDRLADLKRLSLQDTGDQTAIELESNPNEKQQLLDPFFEEIEQIQSSINKLKETIEKVQKLHSFFLLRPAVDEDIRKELDELNGLIKKSALGVKARLKSLSESNDILEAKQPNSTELRIRETQLSFLQKWFVDLLTEHFISQIDYQAKYKDRLKRQLDIMGQPTTDEQLDEMLETGNIGVFTEGLLMETENQRKMLTEIETRHSQILELEKSIKELHDLFIEISLMVDRQGDMIDSIEHNVMKSRNAAEGGRGQLIEAQKKQVSARKKKICCYGILLTVIVIVIASVVISLI